LHKEQAMIIVRRYARAKVTYNNDMDTVVHSEVNEPLVTGEHEREQNDAEHNAQ